MTELLTSSPYPLIAIAVAVLLILFGIVAAIRKKQSGEKCAPDYRAFFNIGIMFFVIGMGSENPGMWTIGLSLLAIGLLNKKKWKTQKKWSEMSKGEKILIGTLISVLLLLFVAGIAVYLLNKNS